MFDLTGPEQGLLMLCAVLVGMAKTGLPGLGIVVVPVMADVLPAQASTGILLPLLMVGDVFAVAYYRRHAVWRQLVVLLPWAVAGVVTGALLMGKLNDAQLGRAIGGIVLALLGADLWRRRAHGQSPVTWHWSVAAGFGFVGGVCTMMANAAGPVMALYFVAMRLPKQAFIGTGAWFYMLVNWIKVPFHCYLGTVSLESLRFSAAFLPGVVVGAGLGILVLRRLPERVFSALVRILAAGAAVKLVLQF